MLLRPKLLFVVGLFGLLSCAPAGEIASPETPKTPLLGGVAEFRLGSFDGETLKGRVLLGAGADTITIDGRLVEWSDIEPKNLRLCDSQSALVFYHMDILTRPPRPDQIVTLKRGYWYGVEVDFLLFGQKIKQPKPDCFEGELILWSADGRVAARVPIRVARTDKMVVPVVDGKKDE